jgi:hypothetical protein
MPVCASHRMIQKSSDDFNSRDVFDATQFSSVSAQMT